MKKELIFTYILAVGIILFITINDYITYGNSTKIFVNNTVEAINENYPDIKEEDIVKVINHKKQYDINILKNYGFSNDDITYLKGMKDTFNKNILLSLSFLVIFIVSTYLVYIIKKKNENKEIKKIINYLKKLNHGIYDLDIIDNKEGLTSILKNEIYTTTIILREKAMQEEEDKKKLKDSLSNISHQLKTPLTSILLMLDSISDENMDKKTRTEFLNDIRNQLENINFLVLAMLKLSRFDANVITMNKEKINVQKLLIECLKNIDILRDLKDINIHIKGNSKITFVGDFKWELEAFTNIVKNCIEYTPNNKNIYISYEDNSVVTKIIIIDEGTGISDKDIKHVFERFYKGNNTSSNNFGIGLSLAKEIIEHDGGSISVSKDINGGTKFIIKYYR